MWVRPFASSPREHIINLPHDLLRSLNRPAIRLRFWRKLSARLLRHMLRRVPSINLLHYPFAHRIASAMALTVAGTRSYNRRMEPYSSFLTWRFDTALQFASGLHHQQARKGIHSEVTSLTNM